MNLSRSTPFETASNMISGMLQARGNWLVPRVTCDAADTYASLWRKAFEDILVSRKKAGLGFTAQDEVEQRRLVDQLPPDPKPDQIRRILTELAQGIVLLVTFDEFDRLQDQHTTMLMADTIKALSDYSVGATVLLIGVADSIDDLVEGHRSIERALVQIPMPRMSKDEITEIVSKGLSRLNMTIQPAAKDEIAALSQGLPYIAHLLSLHSVRAALNENSLEVSTAHVDAGMQRALDQWQQSIKSAYYEATRSQQPGHIFKEVLLACALAEVDEIGFFTASAVRAPLRLITSKQYDIPNFARHLKELSQESRGGMLERVGEKRRLRYRFKSPIMRPYIVMRGYADSLITRAMIRKLDLD